MKKKIKKQIFFMVFIAVSAFWGTGAEAANWYVDNAATGSNNGTTWANAWTSFANIHWGSGGVVAGDTLYISGGTTSRTYVNQSLVVGASGTAGNPITISVGQEEGYNGTAILDFTTGSNTQTGFGIDLNNADNINITGNYNGATHLKIQGLRNTTSGNAYLAVAIGGVGAPENRISNIVVDHVWVFNCNNGVRITYPSNIEVKNSTLEIRGDVGVGLITSNMTGFATATTGSRIHHNAIRCMRRTGLGYFPAPDGIQCSHGTDVYNNTFSMYEYFSGVDVTDQHPDYLQATGDYTRIYNNEFLDIGDSAIDFDGYTYGGSGDNPTPNEIWIYNNVFRTVHIYDPYPQYIRVYSSTGLQSITNVKILHNTFIDSQGSYLIGFFQYNGNPTASGVELKNNIFYNCGTDQWSPNILVESSSNFTTNSFSFSHNIYYPPRPSSDYPFVYKGTNYNTANWIANHSPNSKSTQPVFMSYTVNGANNDLRLADTDTVAKESGADLSGYSLLATDRHGTARPQGTAFDIGAHESAGVRSGLNLRVVSP